MKGRKAAVLGAGSWGTVLAMVLAENGIETTLWARRKEVKDEINRHHTNEKYLPGISLPESLGATTSLAEAVQASELVMFVVPSQSIRALAREVRPYLRKEVLLVHASKGFELPSLKRISTVIAEELPDYKERIAVLSGPSHAEEVAQKSPTTVVVASERLETAEMAQTLLINSYFRVYTNPDVIGIEIGGALKNIIALGAGLSDGLGFGDNAKAALITRGLAEIARLGVAMGARLSTFAGLAGVGDLVVTCTSKHSRNWKAGYLISKGNSPDRILEEMGMVVEGIRTTEAASRLAEVYGVEMPITSELYKVMFEEKDPRQAVEDLMCRVKTIELEEIMLQKKLD